ncbi:S1 RNA-binding domain-containing protein [Aerococcaceae bacterium DSM 111020]|nr:S1 RNA-binding domain-containing protein [Aerococcaceae bacterium DSM 111020]
MTSQKQYQIGDVVEGTVSGIQHYGVFVQLDSYTQGLIHISECKHGYVTDINQFVQLGETLRVMVIDVDEYTHKISLSLRALEQTNVPPYPAKIKYRRRKHQPKIGFKPLEQALPKMVRQGLDEIEYDEYHIPT